MDLQSFYTEKRAFSVEPAVYVIYDERCEGEPEYRCGVSESAVYTCRACGSVAYCLRAEDTFEFTFWEYAAAAESCAQGTGEWTAFGFPEFSDCDFRRVEFTGCSH